MPPVDKKISKDDSDINVKKDKDKNSGSPMGRRRSNSVTVKSRPGLDVLGIESGSQTGTVETNPSANTSKKEDTKSKEDTKDKDKDKDNQSEQEQEKEVVQQVVAAQPVKEFDGVQRDSDSGILQSTKYYDEKIDESRKHIIQITELDNLIGGMPTYEEVKENIDKADSGVTSQAKDILKAWNDYAKKNQYIGDWYKKITYKVPYSKDLNDKISKNYKEHVIDILHALRIINLWCRGHILPERANISKKIELYKQDRDMAEFVAQSKDAKIDIDLSKETIYCFPLGKIIVYGYLDKDKHFRTFRSKADLVNDTVEKQNYWFERTRNNGIEDFSKEYDEKAEQMEAMGELDERLEKSGLMNTVNLAAITEYMNFNEKEFEKKAESYRESKKASPEKAVARPTAKDAFGEYDGKGKSDLPLKQMAKEYLKDKVSDENIGETVEDIGGDVESGVSSLLEELKVTEESSEFLDNLDGDGKLIESGDNFILIDEDGTETTVDKCAVFKGLCAEGGIGIAKCGPEIFSLFKNCQKIKEMMEELEHAGLVGKGGGIFSEAAVKVLETAEFITKDVVCKSAEIAVELTENISKILTGAGKMTAGQLASVLSVTGAISSGMEIGKGVIDLGKGIYDAAKSNHDVKQANGAINELSNSDYDPKMIEQNLRLLRQVELNARESRANAFLNVATGAMDVASSVFSLVPGFGSAVSTALSLASKAASVIGKFAITKFFNGKKKDQAWTDILHFGDVKEYKKFEKKIGTENFHRVLRRKTGVSTREHFSKALNVMDAIDIYTTAKLHSGKKDSSDPDDQIAQMTLGGMNYNNPETYKDITLKDVLTKVGEKEDDWKSTLKASITDAKSIFTGKTREEKEDIHKTA